MAATPTTPPASRRSPPSWAVAVARGVALFLGGFTLLNLIGELRSPGFDANVWWIDLGFLPDTLSGLLLAASAVLLLAWAVEPAAGLWRRRATLAALALLAVAALSNIVTFYRVWAAGDIRPLIPVPFSAVVFAVLVLLAVVVALAQEPSRRPASWLGRPVDAALIIATLLACGVLFPLAQFWFFGHTDYRRAADVAVVPGAQVDRDGEPSVSLEDRIVTAVDLYKAGLVDALIMSGGVGDSGDNEAVVMAREAAALGVPVGAIVIDPEGDNTQATVTNTTRIFDLRGDRRILVVSHYYHLPRLKLAYARAGYDVLTVPAKETRSIPQAPYIVAREIPAFWVYYLRAVLR